MKHVNNKLILLGEGGRSKNRNMTRCQLAEAHKENLAIQSCMGSQVGLGRIGSANQKVLKDAFISDGFLHTQYFINR